jgi:hypothetical protein
MFAGIASVGLVVRPDDEDPEDADELPDPACAPEVEPVHPATATARQTRITPMRKPIAFIPENMGLPYLAFAF